jgi:hypothetical protein
LLSGHKLAPPLPGEPTEWEKAAGYWFFADRFGWTPAQVDDQPAVILDRLREVTILVEEMRQEEADG